MRRALFVLLVACGGGTDVPIDARLIDAPPDVAIDAAIDAPPAPAGHSHYVIDKFRIPTNNNLAREYGLDLNGDLTVDNQLGMVMGTLSSMGFDTQGASDETIDRGTSITLIDLESMSFTTATGSKLALFAGANPSPAPCSSSADTICRKHLAGTASFTAAATPVNPPLEGAFVNGTYTAGPGAMALDITFFGSAPVRLQLIGARAKLSTASATAIGNAVLAGGITQTEIDTKLIPAMRDGFNAAIAADCTQLATPPACGCAAGSTGATMLNLFDTAPKDCTLTVAEVQNNSLIQSLLAPDVEINGMQCLSIGVGATAVHGAFATP